MSEGISWAPGIGGAIPAGAWKTGTDGGANVYVARASHERAVLPGKLVQGHKGAYVPWGGKENCKANYEVLVLDDPSSVSWVAASGGGVPNRAIPVGISENGEHFYVGRTQHAGATCIGKVQPSHHCLYVPYGGKEYSYPNYEVLVKEFKPPPVQEQQVQVVKETTLVYIPYSYTYYN